MSETLLNRKDYCVKSADGEVVIEILDHITGCRAWKLLSPKDALELGKSIIQAASNVLPDNTWDNKPVLRG